LTWPSNATSCWTRFRRRRTPGSARFFNDDRPTVGNGLRRQHYFGAAPRMSDLEHGKAELEARLN
jgi:hypothetical protein